jgi:5-hydroxyisourate hydrolase
MVGMDRDFTGPPRRRSRVQNAAMAKLSTHVLDTRSGTPAVGMRIVLERVDGERSVTIADVTTDGDGRTAEPLMSGESFATGCYRLSFHVAAHYRRQGVELPDPPFLDVVAIAFGIADAEGQYHVPLLVTPWSYSTYRGS